MAAPAAIDVSCRSCGAALRFEPTQRTTRCPYCDSDAVVDRPAIPGRPDPTFASGFAVEAEDAVVALRSWLRRRWLAPAAVRRAIPARIEGIYLPVWLYSARARSTYRARIAERYWETRYDARRKKVRRVRRTEWRDLEGRHDRWLTDVVVTASAGLPNREVEAIEPYDLDGLAPYQPALVAGWSSEEPTVDPADGFEIGRGEARERIAARLREFMPGDGCDGLSHSTSLEEEELDLALLPVWVCSIGRGPERAPIRLLVNGETGRPGGRVPVSPAKVAFLVGVAAALAAVVAVLASLS